MRSTRTRWRAACATALSVIMVVATVSTSGAAFASIPGEPGSPVYGPYTASTAIDGRGSMNPDDRTKTNAYVANQSLYLTCQDTGPSYGGSTIWDYTIDDYWIPDAYVHTGTTGFVSGVPRCLSLGIDGRSKYPVTAQFKVTVDVDGRGSMNANDRIEYNAYLAGSDVFLRCQDHGQAVGGDTVWDYTSDGYWIPDTYVHTGTTGIVVGMPICSAIGIDGTAPTNPTGGQRFIAATDLNGYSGKSLTSSVTYNAYPDGAYVTVMCQAYGQYNYGGDAIWDKTAQGYWVADYYVHTGSSTFVMNRCDNDPISGAGGGSKFLVETTLNGYSGKSLTSSFVNDKYAAGSMITVTCQAYGQYNYGGSAVWDKTTDNLWVADYYVKTGSADIILTKCDNTPKPVGGAGNPTVPPTPPVGSIASAQIRDRIVNAARTQLGTHEWGDNCQPYSPGQTEHCGDAWCSIFASWTWRQAGIDVSIPYSGDFEAWGQRHGTLRTTSTVRPGDLVLFGYGAGSSNHTGVVVDVQPNGAITTIEGNNSNAVREIGPYLPSQAAAMHPLDGPIYAVVAPINDSGDTRWGAEGDPSINTTDDDNSNTTPVCSADTTGPDVAAYKVCVETDGTRARAVAIARPPSAAAYGATVTLTMGSTTSTARCLTIHAPGIRTCATAWVALGANRQYTGIADFVANGAAQYRQRAFSMHVIGEKQTAYNYCGPASTRAALLTMGVSAPDQDTLAHEEKTTTIDFTLPTFIPASLNSRISTTYRYAAYFYANEGLPELVGLEGIKQSLDAGKPVILLVNPTYLPSDWNISSGGVLRHYILIYGYGANDNQIADSVPFDLQQFNIWDPANNRTHTMNLSQLYSYTYDAELVGTGSFVAITATKS